MTKVLGTNCGAAVDPTTACFTGLSCPSTTLCVAGGDDGKVITSINPTGGASAWRVAHVDGSNGISSVSCPSIGFCAAVDGGGNVVTSSNPIGGAAAWTVTHVDASNCAVSPAGRAPCALTSVSCPSSGLCVAVDEGGKVITSNNPTGGPAAWRLSHVDADDLLSVSCPTSNLCVAVDILGNAVTSTNPTGGAAAWKKTHIDGTNCYVGETSAPCWLASVSCPSASLCAAVDASGNVVTSTHPTAGAAAWKVVNVGDGAAGTVIDGVSCPSTTFCIVTADSDIGQVITTTNPTGPASAWTKANAGGTVLWGVSCPDSNLCVIVDYWGYVVTSNNPAGR